MAKPTRKRAQALPQQKAQKLDGRLQNVEPVLERILELLKKHEVAEFEWEHNGERLKLRTKHAVFQAGAEGFLTVGPQRVPSENSARESKIEEGHSGLNGKGGGSAKSGTGSEESTSKSASFKVNQKQVPSPFVGTFYRSASPDAVPYVREGQTVKRGEVLCIIEAMKLMNEIEAELPGKIVSILVENGQPVEYGEPLFIIEP